MSRTVTLRLEEGVFEEFREAAAAEGWTLPNLIETLPWQGSGRGNSSAMRK